MRGAPAVSVILPPSASTSDCRKQTSNSSQTAWTSRDELLDRVGGRLEALAGEQRVDALEAQERGRDHAVLRLRLAARDVRADLAREELLHRRLRRATGNSAGPGSRPLGAEVSRKPGPRLAPSQTSGTRAAVAAEIATSPALARFSIAVTAVAAGPVTISSRCDGPPAKIRWTSPECMPCDIRSVTLPAEVCSAPMRAQPPAHAEGGAARALDVAGPVEEQQQRVAAELQQAAVVAVGLREQLGEGRAEHVDELLGALAAALGEALGELREAGDVGEEQRAVEHPRACLGSLEEVPQDDVRHVCVQVP